MIDCTGLFVNLDDLPEININTCKYEWGGDEDDAEDDECPREHLLDSFYVLVWDTMAWIVVMRGNKEVQAGLYHHLSKQ